jgi:ribonuclease G
VLIESIKPKNFGIIARTAAEGKKVADLHSEVRELMNKWGSMSTELAKTNGPDKLLSEIDKATSILRDVLSGSFSKISGNDKEMVEGIKNYLKGIAPEQVKIVKHYKGQRSIFDANDVTRQIKASFGKTSTMSSGAYLVIEHTEAMHVIDVNSGPKMIRKAQEDASLSVNMEAAEEVARQLRLRDIGGLIIIDFIDMKSSENRSKLATAMRQFMQNDRAQHTILPLSKFGLMQITRQRVRPAVKIDTREVCSTCNGTGKSKASILVTDDINRDLDFLIETRPTGKFSIKVHPFVKSYLTKGLKSIQVQWWLKYRKWIKIVADNDVALFQYTFFDANGDEIRLD